MLKNVAIIDKNPAVDPTDSTKAPIDTFFRAEYIIAKFTLNSLLKSESIGINRAFISNAQMNLVLEDLIQDGEKETFQNLSRIFRIKKKKNKNKYVYLQEVIRKALKADSPIKDGELFD